MPALRIVGPAVFAASIAIAALAAPAAAGQEGNDLLIGGDGVDVLGDLPKPQAGLRTNPGPPDNAGTGDRRPGLGLKSPSGTETPAWHEAVLQGNIVAARKSAPRGVNLRRAGK